MPVERAGTPKPASFANRTLEPGTMQKIAIGLSARLLIATGTEPGAAQDASTAGAAQPRH